MNGLNPDFVPRAALEAAEARCAELEKERDDALESTAWKLMGALQKSEARLATLKAALEDIAQYKRGGQETRLRARTALSAAALQEGERPNG